MRKIQTIIRGMMASAGGSLGALLLMGYRLDIRGKAITSSTLWACTRAWCSRIEEGSMWSTWWRIWRIGLGTGKGRWRGCPGSIGRPLGLYVPLDPFNSPDGGYEIFTLGSTPTTHMRSTSRDAAAASGSTPQPPTHELTSWTCGDAKILNSNPTRPCDLL